MPLPKEAVEYLHMIEGAEVSVEVDRENHQLVITPVEPPLAEAGIDPEFVHQVAEFIEEYRLVLAELAK